MFSSSRCKLLQTTRPHRSKPGAIAASRRLLERSAEVDMLFWLAHLLASAAPCRSCSVQVYDPLSLVACLLDLGYSSINAYNALFISCHFTHTGFGSPFFVKVCVADWTTITYYTTNLLSYSTQWRTNTAHFA